MKLSRILVLILILLLMACNSATPPAPTSIPPTLPALATQTNVPSVTPTVTVPTATLVPSPTQTATTAPTATRTETPKPTSTKIPLMPTSLPIRAELLNLRKGTVDAAVAEKCDDLEITFVAYSNPQEAFWLPFYGTTREQEMHTYIQFLCKTFQYLRPIFGYWPGTQNYSIVTNSDRTPADDDYVRFTWAWPRERYDSTVHHAYHAWLGNPKWGTSLEMDAPEWMWVKEGLTTFYQQELTAQLSGDPSWRGPTYARYLATKRAAQFGLLKKESVNKYIYGSMRALAMDQAIRQATQDQKSLEDVLKLLGARFGSTHKFTRADLVQIINEVTASDLNGFYDRYFAGEVSGELPPVDNAIRTYQDDLLKWLEKYLSPNGRGANAKGYKTIFFVAVEIGLTSPDLTLSESYVIDGAGINGLGDFRTLLEKIRANKPILAEQDVIDVLASITGHSENDFFDFYSIGAFKPSIGEINDWLKSSSPPAQTRISPSPTRQIETKPNVVVDLTNSIIKPDGNPSDWGNRRPDRTPPTFAPAQAVGADVSALYAFADSRFLYLRLDQYGGFPHPPLQSFEYRFDITSPEWGNRNYQVSVPNSGSAIRVLPLDGTTQLTGEIKIYDAVAIGQVLEAVIPLEMIKNPSQIDVVARATQSKSTLPLTIKLKP